MNKRPNHPPSGDNKGRSRRRSRPTNPGATGTSKHEVEVVKKGPLVLKRYGVIFYETHALAKEDHENLANLKLQCDQLNIVVRAEGSMDDPELTIHGRVYAGEAWNLIHKRRMEDGWYNEAHE